VFQRVDEPMARVSEAACNLSLAQSHIIALEIADVDPGTNIKVEPPPYPVSIQVDGDSTLRSSARYLLIE